MLNRPPLEEYVEGPGKIRELINKPRKHAALMKEKDRYGMLCSCLDTIGDTDRCLEAFITTNIDELDINGNSISRSECICYLGEWMEQHLSFKTHIQIKCKSATFNLFRLCKIQSVLTRETANLLALALIISHLDYANAIPNGLPDCDINKMQRIQNITPKMALRV